MISNRPHRVNTTADVGKGELQISLLSFHLFVYRWTVRMHGWNEVHLH